MTTVISDAGTFKVGAGVGDELWLSGADLENVTGWRLKPEGFCKGDVCVPLPAGQSLTRDDQINASKLWKHMGHPVARSDDGSAWVFGEGADARNESLRSLEAPDFTLPDFKGKVHSLSDFRRKKVLLITWASW